ncbi:hypothetical protein MNBD_GAMMA01-1029, partial [hydrothermal vent metagenome]
MGIIRTNEITNGSYGDLRQPAELGSSTSRKLGGGSIRLNVSNTLNLDGQIIANGSIVGDTTWGGASGGSIWLDINTLTGSGLIQAHGSGVSGTPGGGGRIALYYDDLTGFDTSSQVTAYGGKFNSDIAHIQGGAGTVYLKDNAQALGEIRIINQQSTNSGNGWTELYQPTSGNITEPLVIINARVEIQSDVTNLNELNATNSEINQPYDLIIDNLILNNDSSWSQIGQLTVNNTYQINDSSINHQAAFIIPEVVPYIIDNGMRVILNTPHDSWTAIVVQGNAQLDLNVVQANLITLTIDNGLVDFNVSHSFTTVNLSNNGVLTHQAGFAGFTLDIANLSIDATSKIDLSGKGKAFVTGEITGLAGASHAGLGIIRTNEITNGSYGDLRQPAELGSSTTYNLGGGSIRLNVSNTLDLDGQIIANGSIAGHPSFSGASGGSIWLDINTLTGSGLIQVHGSNVSQTPGGGGRIALYYNDLTGFDASSQVTAYGGKYNSNITQIQGGAGTVYLKDNAQALGEIRIINQQSTNSGNGWTELSFLENYINNELLVLQYSIVNLLNVDNATNITSLNSYIEQSAVFTTGQIAGKGFTWKQSDQLNLPNNKLIINNWNYIPDYLQNWSEVQLLNGGSITQDIALDINDIVEMNVDSIIIDNASSINLTALGLLKLNGTSGIFGGSYGGLGGLGNNGVTNPVYGDEFAPNNVGVGGSRNERGGGGIKLTTNYLKLEGNINANAITSNSNGGRASGGSVWLNIGAIDGDGLIKANGGGDASNSAIGGSGGRVAVYYGTNQGSNLSLRTQAKGGVSTTGVPGSDGTVYLEQSINSARVVWVSPQATNQQIDRIRVHFNQDIDALDFINTDVQLTGSTGAITIDSVLAIANGIFDVVLASPLTVADNYQLLITAAILDQNNNGTTGENPADHFIADITLDFTAPNAPTVINAAIAPGSNLINTNTVTIRGTREPNTSLFINGEIYVPLGSSQWSVIIELPAGSSTWELTSVDAAGNVSTATTVIYFFAEDKPAIISMTPDNGSCLAIAPVNIQLSLFDFAANGFDDSASQFLVTDENSQNINGTASIASNLYTFTPDTPFTAGTVGINATVVDLNGVSSDVFNATFVIDQTVPIVPTVDPVSSPTTDSVQTLTGSKEANSSVWINGIEATNLDSMTSWSANVTLSEGTNNLTVSSKDCAENESSAVNVTIVFNNTVPGAVDLTANVDAGGRDVQLDWTSYDEASNGGNIDFYTIYQSATSFTDVTNASSISTVLAGIKTYDINNITPGQTIYYAVVATDLIGLSDSNVTSVEAVFVDTVPPEETGFPTVTDSYIDQIDITWNHSADSVGDLVNYKVYLNDVFVTDIAKEINTYQFTGLNEGEKHTAKVTVIDDQGVESPGRTRDIYTWLPNPLNLQATAHDSRIILSWDSIPQNNLWHSYRVYMSTADFTDVASATSLQNISVTSFEVTGLNNNTTYYFAVTTRNIHGDFDPIVTTVMQTPIQDTDGPIISNVQISGINLQNGITITQPGNITLTATDDSGMASTQFTSSTNVLDIIDGNGSSSYQAHWGIQNEIDGNIDLTITATDVFNNQTTVIYNVNIQLAAPDAPLITFPNNNTVIAELQTNVNGSTDFGATIELLVNGQTLPSLQVDNDNQFQTSVLLNNGINTIRARALNNRGLAGIYSAIITIEVDQAVPINPVALSAHARADGVIRLSWNPDTEGTTQGYNIYRSTSEFVDISAASRLNTQLVSTANFDDLAIPDGQYFYRVTGVSQTSIEGGTSNQISAISDSTPPQASIIYTPQGQYDAVNNIFGAGRVDIELTLSEELLTTPYLSMSPVGGVPIAVTINQLSATVYTGFFELGNQKTTGTVFAVFSAFDQANNRGTDVTTGASIEVDTKGPEMTSLSISPIAPLAYNAGDSITVEFDLDDDVASVPQLFYNLSKPGRTETEVTGLVEISARRWQAIFTLPNDVGVTEAETLSFAYNAIDSLNNVADVIILENQFQIYQGNLPPLDAPFGVNAEALPAGQIKLTWFNVLDAAEYEILRRADSEPDLIAVGRTLGNVLEYTDTPPVDGIYVYAIASVRQENAQEAVSGPSITVSKYSDSIPPNAPTNMFLTLQGSGILATWDASVQQYPGDEYLQYNLYRSSTDPINDVSNLTPVWEYLAQNGAIDSQPSQTEHAYAATAIDRAGNESPPSNTFYLNFELLPVNNLAIDLHPNQDPIISWSHTSSNISNYDVFIEDSGNSLRLNQSPVMDTQFIDSTYTGAATEYSVIAIDDQEQRSLPHALKLPVISTTILDNQSLKRGLMNEIIFTLNNFEDNEFNNISLTIIINAVEYSSDTHTLPTQGTVEIPIVIPGDTTYPDELSMAIVTHYQPTAGESANIHSTETITVEDGGLILSITTDNFLKGTNGQVQLMVQNPGEQSIDIITARNSQESDEIHFRLEDGDGNILSNINLKQVLGNNVITLPNGVTIARIEPGGSYLSSPQDIAIPANADNHLTVVATIDNVYHQFAETQQRELQGISTRQDITIAETSYRGELISIAPELVVGDGQVTIRGKSLNRSDDSPIANVALKVILRIDGFEQSLDVLTNENGEFTYHYTPSATDAGIYQVSIVHPEILDRPIEGTFQVAKLNVSPQTDSIRLPYNVAKSKTIYVKAPRTLSFTNISLGYDSSDQPGGSFLSGLQITNISTIASLINQDSWQQISFDIEADNSTPVSGTIILRVLTNETVGLVPALYTLDYELSTAEPNFQTDPQFIETGVNQGNHITETITLSNQGFSDAINVNISLLDNNNNPAPTWASLLGESQLASLSVGDSIEIAMVFNPPNLLADGNYLFYLRVTAANATTINIPVQVTATQSGVGSIQFKAADVYTATLDENNQPIQGLAGARIKLISEVVTGQEYTGITDANGDFLFEDIPVGKYIYRASKGNHNDLSGRITIKPATTEYEYAFLTQDFINIEWSVTETTITDRYEVVMNLTFETNVPAAVVVIKPVNTNLPDMYPGDVYSGVFEIKNEGLVRADAFELTMPADDEYFSYELLAT